MKELNLINFELTNEYDKQIIIIRYKGILLSK